MGSLVSLIRRTQIVPSPHHGTPTRLHQLDLAFDDVRVRGMTTADRHAVVMALARLLLEAAGVAVRELGDDNA
jgi:hypothetical protein